MSRVPAVILGGSGYVAGELLRLLVGHGGIWPGAVISESQAGEAVETVFPHLTGCYPELRMSRREDLRALFESWPGDRVAVFCAAPHGAAAALLDEVLGVAESVHRKPVAVDLSADFRFASAAAYEEVYGHPHGAPQRLATFTCAVPEHLAETPPGHVAHPGCFTTSVLMATVPLLKLGLIEPRVSVVATTGSTGSGRTPSAGTHHPSRRSNLYAYNPLRHRHAPEMKALAAAASGVEAEIHFIPQSGPYARGIYATVQARLVRPMAAADVRKALEDFYRDARFVRVLADPPRLQDIVGTNRCHLGVAVDGDHLAVFSTLDNLVKGAAGGGVQWMNRLLGMDEETGLLLAGGGGVLGGPHPRPLSRKRERGAKQRPAHPGGQESRAVHPSPARGRGAGGEGFGWRNDSEERTMTTQTLSQNMLEEPAMTAEERQWLLPVYPHAPMEPVSGQGVMLTTRDGREVIDFYGGHAVALLGYGHPRLLKTLQEQAATLFFQSNVVPMEVRARAGKRLVQFGPEGLTRAFFVNSGAEANENALRLSFRKTGKGRVVAVEGAFHGRTAAAGALTWGSAKWYGFPRAPFEKTFVPRGDIEALERELAAGDVAAVIAEPVQGQAGAYVLGKEWLVAARELTRRAGAMLIFDEVQCGLGRSGDPFAAQTYGVTPDLLTMAKGLAGGFPAGAVLVSDEVASILKGGDLGTTFGGGPMACALVEAVIDVIEEENLLANVRRLWARIRQTCVTGPVVDIQGEGFLIGLRTRRPAKEVYLELLEKGIFSGTSGDPHIVRLLPPLTLEDKHVDALEKALREIPA